MALLGIIKMQEFATTFPAPQPDSTLFVGHGDPNTAAGFTYQRWPIRTLAARLSPDGPVVRALGQQWVVMVASKWNDQYRSLISDALGLEKLVVEALRDARRTYETTVWLVRMAEPEQAAVLGESLFGSMLLTNWLVLHRSDPGWLLDRRSKHKEAVLLYYRVAKGASSAGADLSRLEGQEEDLRQMFGEFAQRVWWMSERDGTPLEETEIVDRLGAAEMFRPRLRGESPVLDQMHAALAHMTSLPRPAQEDPGGPNAFQVLFTSYWTFSQTIFAALELGAPGAIEHFEKLFISGQAVFSEALGVPSPWAAKVVEWAAEAAEPADASIAQPEVQGRPSGSVG